MNLKKIIAILTVLTMLLGVMAFATACGEETPDTPTENLSYQVTVVDGLGQPYTEKIIVKFISNTE